MMYDGVYRAQSVPLTSRDHTLQDESGHCVLNLSHLKRSPKWSFCGRHHPSSRMESPGPGAYTERPLETMSRYMQSPRFAFGGSRRDEHKSQKVPGPGAYSCRGMIGSEGRAWSLTPRRHGQLRNRDLPGPGAHDAKSSIGTGPKYTASPRRAEHVRHLGPGPGEYDQTNAAIKGKEPRWGFGTSQRPDSSMSAHSATPGPGSYAMASAVGGGPRYSMQSRRPGPRPQQSPGPGAHGGLYSTFG